MEPKDRHCWRAGSPWLTALEMGLFVLAQLSFFASSFQGWDFSFLPDWKLLALSLLGLALGNHFPRLKSALAGSRLKKGILALCLLLALLALTRAANLVYGKASLNSDRLVTSLMTRHIVEGKSRPVYFYGQQYQGCLNVYLYALAFHLLPDLSAAIALTNLLVFALALLVAYRLLAKFVIVPPVYYFLFMISLFASLYTISLDTTRGFQLWALLFFAFLLLCYQVLFENKHRPLACGLLGGLLFYQYQPSAPVILFLLAWVIWRKRSIASALLIAGGFAAGCFPHLLSEAQSRFAGSQALLFHGGDGGMALKNLLPIFFYPAHRFNNLVLPAWTAFLFDLLFVLGFGHCLLASRKDGAKRLLFLPLVYVAIVAGLFLSGLAPQEGRYRAHFAVYSILAAQFMAIPFSWPRIFPAKTAKALWVAALCLFNGIALGEFFHEHRAPHRRNRSDIATIARLDETVVLGGYWETMRFAPFLPGNKIILTAPSLRDPNVFHAGTVKYMPHVLALAAGWEDARCALLIKAGSARPAARILRALAVNFRTAALNKGLVLFYGFSKRPSLELAALLCAERLRKFAGIAGAIPAPGTISSVSLSGNVLHFEAAMSDPARASSPYHKIILTHECPGQRLEIPFDFRGGIMDWRLAEAVSLPAGPYRLQVFFLDFPLLEQRLEIAAPVGAPPGRGAGISFERLSPRTRVLAWNAAAGREEGIAGVPAQDLACTILAPEATALTLSLYSLLDLTGPGWFRQPGQELLVTRNGTMRRMPLRPGLNRLSLPVRQGDHIRLATRHSSFFRVLARGRTDLEGLDFVKTGAMLQGLALQGGAGQRAVTLLPQLIALK